MFELISAKSDCQVCHALPLPLIPVGLLVVVAAAVGSYVVKTTAKKPNLKHGMGKASLQSHARMLFGLFPENENCHSCESQHSPLMVFFFPLIRRQAPDIPGTRIFCLHTD